MSPPVLLITGVTGFVGSHVLLQAIDAGYSIKAVCRPAKAAMLRSLYGSGIEVIVVDDLANATLSEDLKGVHAVIHIATALPVLDDGNRNAKVIETAMHSTLRLLRQAKEAEVSRFIMTSSISTSFDLLDPSVVFKDCIYTEADWNPISVEMVLDGKHNGAYGYIAGKTFAEREVWKYADEHPEIDVTTINPPVIFGPFARGFCVKKGDPMAMSTGGAFVYNVLSPTKLKPVPRAPFTVDVRDLARAHILAIAGPSSSALKKRKRLIVAATNWSFSDAVTYLTEARPELKGRLSDIAENEIPTHTATLSTGLAAEVLGMTEYIDWRKTIDDMVDSVLEVEKNWEIQQTAETGY